MNPLASKVLTDPDQIRALAQTDRLAMVRLLGEEPRTVSWLAGQLNIPANRAHYHLQQLIAHDLVVEVATGPRRWKSEERFYAATARNFLVDPSLGAADPDAAKALARASEAVIQEWHRRKVIAVDFAQIAARAINHGLRLRRGEHVLVLFSPFALELAEAMLVEAEAIGAHAHFRPWSRNSMLRMADRCTHDELKAAPYIPDHLDEKITAVVFVHSLLSQGPPPNPEQMAKITHHLDAISRWNRSLRARAVRHLMMSVPYQAEFALAPGGPDAGADLYWRSILADNAEMHFRGRQLRRRAADGRVLRLRGPEGADFTMPIEPSLTQIGDGVICEDDINCRSTFEQLPAGQLTFLPGDQPASGVFYGDYALVSGVHCRGVKVVVRDGVLHDVECRTNTDVLRSRLKANIGSPGAVGSIVIGINPVARGITGKHALDLCAQGNVSLVFGNNELMGGSVSSTFTLILPSAHMSASLEDTALVRDGVLA